MSVKVGTFTITVPGHITRRSKDNGTELEITGFQARYIFETLSEVTHLMPEDEPSEPQSSVAEVGPVPVPSHLQNNAANVAAKTA